MEVIGLVYFVAETSNTALYRFLPSKENSIDVSRGEYPVRVVFRNSELRYATHTTVERKVRGVTSAHACPQTPSLWPTTHLRHAQLFYHRCAEEHVQSRRHRGLARHGA